MEDILASIRRILNEEESPADTAVPDEGAIEDDVLEIDDRFPSVFFPDAAWASLRP